MPTLPILRVCEKLVYMLCSLQLWPFVKKTTSTLSQVWIWTNYPGYSFTAVILIPSSTPDLKLLKQPYYIGQVKATRLDNLSMTSSSDVSAIEKRSNSFRKHVEDG